MTEQATTSIPAREPTRNEGAAARDFTLIVLTGLVFFSLNVDFVLYGDAALYADYVVLRKFDELTLHIGYYGLVYAADLVARGLFGIPIQETMVWLNVVAGSLTLGVSYLLGRHVLRGRNEALLVTLVLAVSGRVFTNATSSEIYMVQTLLVLASFLCFVRQRPLLSGALAALAMLVSPLSVFAYAFYFAWEYQRSRRLWSRALLLTMASGAALYVPYLTAFGGELLWGVRGLLSIRDVTPVSPLVGFTNFCKYQFEAYTVMLVLLLPAAMAWRERRPLVVLAAAVFLPHLYVIVKLTGEDNVFILPTDFFFSCLIVVGWSAVRDRWNRAWIPTVLIVGHAALYVLAGGFFAWQPHRAYESELRGIADRYVKGQDAVLVTDWGTAQAFVFYGRDSAVSVVRMDSLYAKIVDIENLPGGNYELPAPRSILLLDTWKAGAMSRLLRGSDGLRRQEADWSTLGRARRLLNIECTLVQSHFGRLYQCNKSPGSRP